jgi:ceramide glucosyltransferase
MNGILAGFALLSLALLVWQWLAARPFPLHKRVPAHSFPPGVTLLKPLKGCDSETRGCLRSWFVQDYTGRVQILFGVAATDDPVCEIVRELQREFSHTDSSLIVCGPLLGTNAKLSKMAQLEPLAKHELLIISDADVRVSPDFLANFVEPLRGTGLAPQSNTRNSSDDTKKTCGLVCCFYQQANPSTVAMQWEAICINADFWSQVLQSKTLKPLDFALGAVMGTHRAILRETGGFAAFINCLADDYQLGNRISREGYSIEISTVVADCFASPMSLPTVWKHQLRWARTIRVCQPVPYFFSILSNPTLWPLAWLLVHPTPWRAGFCVAIVLVRTIAALNLQQRLTRSKRHFAYWWLVPVKDLLQAIIWFLAFMGNTIEWRGQRMRLGRDGTLEKC